GLRSFVTYAQFLKAIAQQDTPGFEYVPNVPPVIERIGDEGSRAASFVDGLPKQRSVHRIGGKALTGRRAGEIADTFIEGKRRDAVRSAGIWRIGSNGVEDGVRFLGVDQREPKMNGARRGRLHHLAVPFQGGV